ncbi:NfeD family protein [Methylomonas rivi]|uniref:NfeD family protein n=1 Tax=Methylomonas rivi TaxID=2952226 RepID=A0ABT1U647_9GAMM|nr:NfeD family protein [Methylomonas sp. WSC-6]MBS4052983.1 NfeD family protein [Methylomonas sp.]MCQ8129332.1 NfeD family protein [Methylomonas sp. WSC-6]
MGELEIVFWYWWVLAVGFLAVELLAPGFFFLWLAVSAFVVGSVLLMIPAASFEVQLLLFSLLAVTSILVWRRYVSAKAQESDQPLLNQRGAQYIGRIFNVVTAIENGQGKIKVGDSLWLVRGEDCPVGSKVKVVAVKGAVFEVEVSK